MENMLTKTKYLLAILIGFITGLASYYFLSSPKIEVEFREIEKVVEKIVEVEKIETIEVPKIVTEIERVEVPKIITKTVIKEVPVVKTRIVYMPAEIDNDGMETTVDPSDLHCMTLNIYREANNQSITGQIAVARVVINRVQDRRYPAKPCDVIYEGPTRESWKTKKDTTLADEDRIYYPIKNKCQFSWYCDGKADEILVKNDNIKWKIAEDIAFNVLAFNKWSGIIGGATHYHATYVSPTWRKQMRLIGRIDDHIFYRWD